MRTKVIVFVSSFLALVVAGYWIWNGSSLDGEKTPVVKQKDNAIDPKPGGLTQTETAFLDKLVKRRSTPIDIRQASDFVAQDQPVSFTVESNVEATGPRKRHEDPNFQSDTPITPFDANEKPRSLITEQPVDESGHARSQSSTPQDDGRSNKATLHATARRDPNSPSAGTQLKEFTAQLEAVMPQKPDTENMLVDQKAQLTKKSYPLEVQSIGELLIQHGKTVESDDLFYLHTVHESDKQGIWGIIHGGITRSFSQGVRVTMAADIGILRVTIPGDADEPLADKTSSYLGKLIYEKSTQSYVYNFKENRMGQNPDLLRPGQEIVIVTFRPSELISIYRHFHGHRG